MPFTFPSHPGLVLPLWLRRPDAFDALALTVASLLPDLVDAAIEWPTRDFTHNFAHSLLGMVTVVIPLGVGFVYLNDLVLSRRLRRFRAAVAAAPAGGARALASREALWLRRLAVPRFRPWRVLVSVAVGAFSHLLFDALSHDRLDWFLPWMRPTLLPESFEGPWLEVWVRGLSASVKVGLFGVMWLGWTVLGAVLLGWCLWVARSRTSWR